MVDGWLIDDQRVVHGWLTVGDHDHNGVWLMANGPQSKIVNS